MLRSGSFSTRRRPGIVLGLLLAAAASGRAAAQPLPVGIPSLAWPGLTQGDIDRAHAAAARLYEGRSIGTVERWRNPDTGDAGEVTLVQSFETHGMPCRTINYTVAFATVRNTLDHYTVNWCQVPGGAWKIVELPEPH